MDPLAAIVTLLEPRPMGTKIIHGNGRWGVRYAPFGQPSFALVVEGQCVLQVDGARQTTLSAGDFVFFSAMPGFTLASDAAVSPKLMRPAASTEREEIFHGVRGGKPRVRLVGGYFALDPINAPLLLGFLPPMLRIRAGEPASRSVSAIVELIQREATERRPGRMFVLSRLLEIMLFETLRAAPIRVESRGLLAGLRDPRIGAALRGIHARVGRPWTLARLAKEAGMSRSSFAQRFSDLVGTTPLHYLFQWRLALAKRLLAREDQSVAEAAMAVGYESASGFSTAFSREVGVSPREFARRQREQARSSDD